jgi:hypothetical protein
MSEFIDVYTLIGKPIKDWHIIKAPVGTIQSYSNIKALPVLSTTEYEDKRYEIIEWLSKYTTEEWTIINYLDPEDAKIVIGFKSSDDAILFKLTWA